MQDFGHLLRIQAGDWRHLPFMAERIDLVAGDHPRSSSVSTGANSSMDSTVMGSSTSCTWLIPAAAYCRIADASSAVEPLSGGTSSSVVAPTFLPAPPVRPT